MSLWQKLKIVFTNKRIWPPLLVSFGSQGVFSTFLGAWAVPYLMQVYGLSRELAAGVFSLATVGMMVGFFGIGFFSERILGKRRTPAVIFCGVFCLIWFVLAFWNGGKPPLLAIYPMYILMGFFSSAVMVALAVAKEVSPPHVSGLAMGAVNIGGFLGATLLQPVFGYILDLRWQGQIVGGTRVYPLHAFQWGLILLAIVTLIGVVGALLTKETCCRDLENQPVDA